jgi:hypothetical protein
LVFSCPPIVFIQPKASSTRLRIRWLTAYPACRVVRPSIADERPLVFCATCGVALIDRGELSQERPDDSHAVSSLDNLELFVGGGALSAGQLGAELGV